jgi:2'-5' RNA ligase
MRLFVAVRPPDSVLDDLAALPRPQRTLARWTTRDQWHITLRFLGNVEDASLVITALERVAARSGPAEVRVGPRAGVLGHEVVYLPIAGLDELARAVVRETAGMGDPPEKRRFRGHLTLARTKGGIVDLSALKLAASWTVGEIELIRSHLGGGPARYETLATLPLSG